jgi:diketogulonate reductase-like aldo/keto reductase
MIRWSIQRGYITLPKSVTPSRIAANADVFGFVLSDHDMDALNSLDEHLVTGWDPTTLP